MVLEAIKYERGSLQVLDQLQLPHKTHYDVVKTTEDAWHSIHDMRVRGAPAIAIVAALGVATDLYHNVSLLKTNDETLAFIRQKLHYLVTSRPTAVNLANAVSFLEEKMAAAAANAASTEQGLHQLQETYLQYAEGMLRQDVEDNKNIGRWGSQWILANASGKQKVNILTHCNTGSLATAGYGTALGVIRSLHHSGSLTRAYCTETRPYNQGSRLTAFELLHDQIPATLITDSMAASLFNTHRITAVVVGADRVVANGDTANKIGTYALAIAARYHGVKFVVAAPRTTIDLDTPSGDSIKIEERPGREMTTIAGPRIVQGQIDLDHSAERISIAAEGINVSR